MGIGIDYGKAYTRRALRAAGVSPGVAQDVVDGLEYASLFAGGMGAARSVGRQQMQSILQLELRGAERIGSALKADMHHRAASFGVDIEGLFHRSFIYGKDGIKYNLIQKQGTLNGQKGIFEWVMNRDTQVTHQRFIPRGKVIEKVNQQVSK